MSPRSRFVILLVLSALSSSYGQQTGEGTDSTAEVESTTAGAGPSTTSNAPTPAPAKPADPSKPPAAGSWNVSEGTRTCILSTMGIRIGFSYVDKDNNSLNVSYDIPVNGTNINGSSCGASNTADETLAIGFYNDGTDEWKLTLKFRYDSSKKNWAANDVQLDFITDTTLFPNITASQKYTVLLANQTLFQTANSSSYQCRSDATLKDFVGADNPPTVNITTVDLRVEAFRQIPGEFSTAVPCPADTEVSNIVPIAVGAALAALVVIVLIAYLIGRKKNKRGYESV